MNAVRSAVFVVWMYGLMVVMGVLCAPALLGPRSWVRACLRAWLALVMGGLRVICGVRVEVRGREHIPHGPALVASKHHSMFETIAHWGFLPDPAIILKKSLIYLPFFGQYALKLRNIVLDRKGYAAALKQMLKDAKTRAEEGRQVLIFPEGTRAEPGAAPDYKPGVAALYKGLGLPCTPVALTSGVHWPAHGFIRKPGTIVVEFLPAIEPGLPREAFMAELEQRIETATNRLLAQNPAYVAPETASAVAA